MKEATCIMFVLGVETGGVKTDNKANFIEK